MMDKSRMYELLDSRGVVYDKLEHTPVYTIEEMDAIENMETENVVKNLFLRDDKGKRHYLVTLPGHEQIDLKALADKIGSRKLSFASEERLAKYLGLTKGAVTPFGILNDENGEVTFVYEKSLSGSRVGIHPMENTATVFLNFDDVLKLIEEHGNEAVSFEA